MRTIERYESQVRSYVRSFPTVFERAKGALLWDREGKEYIDFFAGAGTLNYGHNNPKVSEALIKHIQADGIVHGLDKATVAKIDFLERLQQTILQPRNLDYMVQFTGPTGTNAVETALKLARMVKRRSNVVSFTNGYHGLTMGALAVTGNDFYRDESYGVRVNADSVPFDGYFGADVNTIDYLRKLLQDGSSGVDLPAAIIVESVQAEGGVNVASVKWLQELSALCQEMDILLIMDEIQVGNGRTGTFFSFEEAGIYPDIVCLSKSLGGGLPLAILLIRHELDQWQPGEHTGTFRGNNLAFVAATQLFDYWETDDFSRAVVHKGKHLRKTLEGFTKDFPEFEMSVRGKGMILGMECPQKGMASAITTAAFERGLILETCGNVGQVVKFLPSLTITEENLNKGLAILKESIETIQENRAKALIGEEV
ncbi:MAG: diaminobutyrate--2-oxoglutarate transaminase [bacterium]|nr:diaminobutyrate--2-oxoglutarate transaminase [bacterium]